MGTEGGQTARTNLGQCAFAIDFLQEAGLLIIGDERLGLPVEGYEPSSHRLRIVVGALVEFATAGVADAGLARGLELQMVGGLACSADHPARQAAHQRVVRDFDV